MRSIEFCKHTLYYKFVLKVNILLVKVMTAKESHSYSVKHSLLDNLKREKALWSYDVSSIRTEDVADDQLIALTLQHLDLPEINMLFDIFSFRKIKNAWKNILIPQGDYLYTMNRFFAWYYFKAKNPDSYLKSLMTRHRNRMFS